MKRIEIEFFINRQGSITSTIKGVKGPDCVKIGRALENGLGRVIEKSKTAAYFDRHESVCLSLHQKTEKF